MTRQDDNLDALIAGARSAEAPSEEDRAVVLAALTSSVGALGAASGAGVKSMSAASGSWYSWLWGGPFVPLGVSSVICAGAIGLTALSYAPPPPKPAEQTAAAVPTPSASSVVLEAPRAPSPPATPSVASVDLSEIPSIVATSRGQEPSPAQLGEEGRGLVDIQRALRDGNAAQALALLESQDRLFPNGSLVEERRAARVLALCAAGNRAAARAAAERFLEKFPDSVLAPRVRDACSDGVP